MNYEDLRAIQRKERNTQRLADIPSTFYEDLSLLINGHKDKQDVQDARDLDNIYKIAKDIFERREQKIFYKALRDARISEYTTELMLSPEKEFYELVVESVKCNKSKLDSVLLGNFCKIEKKGPICHIESEQDLNTVLLKITSEVPKFLSSNFEEIGPFKAQEIIKLLKKDADALLTRNLAEII